MADRGADDRFEQSLDWRLREAGLDADGWRAFADWIDADPANRAALARADAADDALRMAKFAAPAPVSKPQGSLPFGHHLSRRWAFGTAAVAACVVAGVLVGVPRPDSTTDIATRPGETRAVALSDGSHATLNGATRLRFSRAAPRRVELAAGEAVFSVRHDPAQPFRVTVGAYTIEDVGTVFNVNRAGKTFSVAVSEGHVTVGSGNDRIPLSAGQALTVDTLADRAVMRPVATAAVAGWQSGLLTFADEPMSAVADALARRSGANLRLDQALKGERFTGSVRLSGNADRDVPHLAALIGAKARYDGTQWILSVPR